MVWCKQCRHKVLYISRNIYVVVDVGGEHATDDFKLMEASGQQDGYTTSCWCQHSKSFMTV